MLPTVEPNTPGLSIPGSLLGREESWVAMPGKIQQDGRSEMQHLWLYCILLAGSTGSSVSSLSPFLALLAPPCQPVLLFWLMFVTSTGSFGPSFAAFPALSVPPYCLYWLL